MTRMVAAGIALGTDAPWFLTVLVTCPKCGQTFYLTSEDFQPMAGPFGINDTIWHWWRELAEGSPDTAPLDLANYHLDPAQVAGPCPNCFYPVYVRGPRYGTTKITSINTDPVAGDIPVYIQNGAVKMGWYTLDELHLTATQLVGLFLDVTGRAIGATYDGDGNSVSAPGIVRDLTSLTLDTDWLFHFVVPNHRIETGDARARDANLVETVERYGLVV